LPKDETYYTLLSGLGDAERKTRWVVKLTSQSLQMIFVRNMTHDNMYEFSNLT